MITSISGTVLRQQSHPEAPLLFVFVAPASEIRSWAGVRRTAEHPKGAQRVLRPARVRSIARFLNEDLRNTIPTAVLLAFPRGNAAPKLVPESATESTWQASLEISFDPSAPEHQRPALIVDGQHRLEGAAKSGKSIICVAMLEASDEEQAFQFIVINNKATRVPSDNVKAIIAAYDEAKLDERLRMARVRQGASSSYLLTIDGDADSPFRGRLEWPRPEEDGRSAGIARNISLSAVEYCVERVRTEFPELKEDEDTAAAVVCAIWRGVLSTFTVDAFPTKIMTKVGIASTTDYIVHSLKGLWILDLLDVFDSEDVERRAASVMAQIDAGLWTSEWSIRVQDNANVRRLISDAFATIALNARAGRSWDFGVDLVAAPKRPEE